MEEEIVDEVRLSALEMAMYVVDHSNSIGGAMCMLQCLVNDAKRRLERRPEMKEYFNHLEAPRGDDSLTVEPRDIRDCDGTIPS